MRAAEGVNPEAWQLRARNALTDDRLNAVNALDIVALWLCKLVVNARAKTRFITLFRLCSAATNNLYI